MAETPNFPAHLGEDAAQRLFLAPRRCLPPRCSQGRDDLAPSQARGRAAKIPQMAGSGLRDFGRARLRTVSSEVGR